MSEEEIKAIESVKSMFEDFTIEELIKDKDINITIYSLGILDILKVIEIIDKQQKEKKDLKTKNKKTHKVYKKICKWCGKEYIAKSTLSKYCGLNCRCVARYHKEHPEAKKNITGRTKEEKKKLAAEYQRKRYNEDKEYREMKKMNRRSYYKRCKK